MIFTCTLTFYVLQIKIETANIWKYTDDNNANITNFVCLWKTRMCVVPAEY